MPPHSEPVCAPAIAELLREPRLQPLGPGTPNQAVYARLKALTPATAFAPQRVQDEEMARACLAGLWLYHDYLDESHKISQDLESPTGSFWHAIMHRREPDASNSKYWWRRVGSHPVLELLTAQAGTLGYSYTSPFAFVDFCERARDASSAEEELAKRVQQLEWQLLFEHCYRAAMLGAAP